MKTLVAGWFSFENGHATAGDLLSRDVACEWLREAGLAYDVAVAPPFEDGLDWHELDPHRYSHVLFVCGPFARSELETEFLERFAECRLIGLNLSMQEPLTEWHPFDLLSERDSSRAVHPDLAFVSSRKSVPVVGVCLVEPYPGALDGLANQAIQQLRQSRAMAVVEIDTRLDSHSTNDLKSAEEIESLIARVDVLITTRLHGLVLALKNGIPAVAIDPERGGAKIRSQAELLGWPACFLAEDLDDRALRDAFEYCLTDAAAARARQCRVGALQLASAQREAFVTALKNGETIERNYRARLAARQSESARATQEDGSGDTATEPGGRWWRKVRSGWQKLRRP